MTNPNPSLATNLSSTALPRQATELAANPSTPPDLRDYTPARVALTSTGTSLTTRHALEFALAHAQARDAVHSILDLATLTSALEARTLPHLRVQSAAPDRTTYLRRPDLGRTLATTAGAPLFQFHRKGGVSFAEANDRTPPTQPQTATLTIILADGLSATATNRHAIPLLDELIPLLDSWRLTPILLATQARVALADPIGQALRADATLILIGERPGLSSPDSLGAYITWAPRPGRTDAERNCVSNIRPPLHDPLNRQAGLDYATAAQKIAWYLTQARRLGLTGITLREPSAALLP